MVTLVSHPVSANQKAHESENNIQLWLFAVTSKVSQSFTFSFVQHLLTNNNMSVQKGKRSVPSAEAAASGTNINARKNSG